MSQVPSISPAPSTMMNVIRRASDTRSGGSNAVERDKRTLVFNPEVKKSAGFFSRALNWLLGFFCFRPRAEKHSNLSVQSPSLLASREKMKETQAPALNPLKAKLCNDFCDLITTDFCCFAAKMLLSPASKNNLFAMQDKVCEDYRKRFIAEFDKAWPREIFDPSDALLKAYARTEMLGGFRNAECEDIFNGMRSYYQSDLDFAAEQHATETREKYPRVHDFCCSILAEHMNGWDAVTIAKLGTAYVKTFAPAYQKYCRIYSPQVAVCAAHLRASDALKRDMKREARESGTVKALYGTANTMLRGVLMEIRKEFGIRPTHARDARALVPKKRVEK